MTDFDLSKKFEDIATTKDEIDTERHFLGTTVTLSDGTEGLVFSRGSKNESGYFLYNCHLCGAANLPGERSLQTHITGRKHQSRLSQPVIDAQIFRAPLTQKSIKIQMNIAPGEPVPPGFENEVKPMPQIQGFINKYKEHALIGVEYCLELSTRDSKEPNYMCILCDKRTDPRTIISHWTSYNHRLKYLEKHYPSVVKELIPYRYNPEARNVMPRLIQTLAEAIEDHYGRLTATVVDNNEFKRNRNKVIQEINLDKHFDEKDGPNFINAIDKKMIDNLVKGNKAIPINIDTKKKRESTLTSFDSNVAKRLKSDSRRDRNSFDSISSDSDSSITRTSDNKNKKLKSQSPAYRVVSRVKRSPPFEEEPKIEKKMILPTPRELSMQASEIAQERYKWEKYRCLVDIAVEELNKKSKEYDKYPESHPLYPNEWKTFWNRRYKELQTENKDPNKYDFKPEWVEFWTKRIKELHEEEIEKKKKDIKRKLGFSENAEEKTDQLKQQYKVKAPVTSKSSEKTALPVIDISDDEDSITSRPRSRTYKRRSRSRSRSRSRPHSRARARSRSFSSLSDEYDSRYRRGDKLRERIGTGGRADSRDKSRDREREDHKVRGRESYFGKEREVVILAPRERYPPPPTPMPPYIDHYRHPIPRPSYYPSSVHPSSHYSYRTMASREMPQYEPKSSPSAKKEEEEEGEPDEGPLTVVGVLRLLTALEDHLGSLGPKVVDLLSRALALEKVKANSSDDMLLNEDNCVFFETVKEKLKGQLIADVLDSHKIKAVKKAIKNIAAIIYQVNNKANEISSKSDDKDKNEEENKLKTNKNDLPFDRQLVASKLAAALVKQEKTDVSTEDMDKLIHVFILMVKESQDRDTVLELKDILITLGIQEPDTIEEPLEEDINLVQPVAEKEFAVDMFEVNDEEEDAQPMNSLESLTDSDLQTLLQNFKHLSSEEQHHLIAHLKKLESTDPIRVEKLRKFVDLSEYKNDENDNNKSSSELTKDMKNSQKITSIYSDDEENNRNTQKIIDSEDDDDYNFDEVVKAASKKIKDPKHIQETPEKQQQSSNNAVLDAQTEISKTSSTSTVNNINSLTDTQNIIANLMGSLQRNSQIFSQQTATNTKNGNTIPTIINQTKSTNNRNIATQFYQQQQPAKQMQQQQMPQFANQQMNPLFPSAITNQQNSNINPNQNMYYNQQSNFNLNTNAFNQPQQQYSNQIQMQMQQTNNNLANVNSQAFDLRQLQPSQVQQMITNLLNQQQQQQQPHGILPRK